MYDDIASGEPPDGMARILHCLLRGEPEIAVAADRIGLRPAEAASWREALIDLAYRELPPIVSPSGWVQIDIELAPDPASYVSLLNSDLLGCVYDWFSEHRVRDAWYVHKAPGVRLRLDGDVAELRTDLAAPADGLIAAGAARSWRFGDYLPESHLFGGAAGLHLTHRIFTADSIAVLRHYRLYTAGLTSVGTAEFSLAVLLTLASITIPERWERWGAWCGLEAWGRLAEQNGCAAGSGRRTDAQEWIRQFVIDQELVGATNEERDILSAFRQEVTAALAAPNIDATTAPIVHPRLLLPAWTAFHWNRMGFPLNLQRTLGRLLEQSARPLGRAG